jgi:hypothetical protein
MSCLSYLRLCVKFGIHSKMRPVVEVNGFKRKDAKTQRRKRIIFKVFRVA